MGDVVQQQDAVALGDPRERLDLGAGLDGAVRVDGVDDADRTRARRNRGLDGIGIEPESGVRADRHRHRQPARGKYGGRHMEVARIADDDLITWIYRRHQRKRQTRLGPLGADDLEAVSAGAAELFSGSVAQRLDQVGGVLVQRLGADRAAHRLNRGVRRAAEARQPAQIRPARRIESCRPGGVDLGGVHPQQRDRVPVGHVVPHAVMACAHVPQALGERDGRCSLLAPGEDAAAHLDSDMRCRRPTR